MNYGQALKDGFKTLVFNKEAVQRLANEPKATGYGFLTLILAGLALGIGYGVFMLILFKSFGSSSGEFMPGISMNLEQVGVFIVILLTVSVVISFFISYSIFHFLAKFLAGGKGSGTQYFRALSNIFVIEWIAILPFISLLILWPVSLWILAANVFILKEVNQISTTKAVLVGIIPVAIGLLLYIALQIMLYSGTLGALA